MSKVSGGCVAVTACAIEPPTVICRPAHASGDAPSSVLTSAIVSVLATSPKFVSR